MVFIRNEPWRNQAAASVRPGYTRKDAVGQGEASAPESKESPPGQGAATAGSTASSQAQTASEQLVQDSVKKPNGEFLTKSEMALIRELQKADQAVKAHEMAHVAAAGGYARGGASFSYQRGPDGQNYAIGGEVQIDTGKEATPEATIQKMQIIRQAALAPVDPSPQDQRVAAHATLQMSESFKELRQAQSVQSQPATPQAVAKGDEDSTRRGIYQEAAQGLDLGATPAGAAGSKKGYAAYRKPLAPVVRSDRQGLHHIA